ncbi:Flavodoxin reductases (ferredoxin-NADPH reductases) family 1 [Methanosarcina horonobensis HB-1 = JCM 15518]|uniref:Flavodoxin reductases (Ferredoxin-NADPH reductases) family 1 n=1 Tax=Methanosarcina horonobensis HB-1 = JCM 15518 TaxID=1434110 RepID=A0A0E3SBZ8_9EURY|nr:FAD-dependent oxidoreductase [Methanosarcina horonobensis]AKB78381.1 Flavodoxin reductases (ferredoxin-NADPH reductases) family 1 [Methanosarcina horonobensis HB-1 = JCM 15518]
MIFKTNVIETVQRTPDIKSIRFEKPQGFHYLAGQYIFVTLGNGPDQMTKHFTLSSSPTEGFLEITKRLTGHPFANALASLSSGDKVSMMGAYGDFTFQGEYDKVGMLSGGIGITPLRSMIKYSIDKKLSVNIILLYSNRFEDDIAFRNELKNMQTENSNIKVVETITKPGPDWKGESGRINAEMIKKFMPDYMESTFYSSGPQKMVDAMVSLLKELGVPEKQIRQEYFPGYD